MSKVIFWKINIFLICTCLLNILIILSGCLASQRDVAEETKKPKATITIRAATPKEEFNIILYTLGNMAFFQKHGYDVDLPDNDRFTQLSKLSVKISQVDEKELYELFVGEIYDEKKYEVGLKNLLHAEEIIVKALPVFEKFKTNWDFKIYKSYDVILTIYGPGGQYNPETGKIFLKTTAHGQFKRIDPIHTIIHEMVHIGIDKSIVKEYQLKHWEKERVVDLICFLAFGDMLHNYKLQSKGEKRLDAFIKKDSIMNLPLAIKSYMNQKNDPKRQTVDIIVIDKVFKGSQAENVGLQEGDIVIEYDGERITSPEKLVKIVKKRTQKNKIEMVIIRRKHIERFIIKGGSIGIKIANNTILRENLPKEYQ